MTVTLARLREQGYLAWQSLLAWMLLALAVAQMLLFFGISTPNALSTLPVLLLYPLTILGAAIILLATARLHHDRRRLSTLLMAGALVCSAVAGVYQAIARVQQIPTTTPATEALFMLAYLCGFAAAALYFPWRSAWVGNALRVVLDSVTLGCAAFIFTYSWVPQLHNPAGWALHLNSYLAIDIGLLFALIVVVLRYGPGGGPIVVLMCLAIGCLFLGDFVFTFFTLIPGGTSWRFITGPFYSLYSVLTALGYYRSVKSPPEIRGPRSMRQPGLEWFLWTAFPSSIVLAALTQAALGAVVPAGAIVLLFLLGVARVGVAAVDLRRAEHDLLRVHEQEQQIRRIMQFFQHELKGYASELEALTPVIQRFLFSADAHRVSVQPEVLLAAFSDTTNKITTLMQQLLILSREGTLTPQQRQPISHGLLLRQIKQEIAMTLLHDRPDVVIDVEAPTELIVYGDPLYLSLALRTALQNAVEAIDRHPTQGEARVVLKARAADGYVQLRIEDTGSGFPLPLLNQMRASGASRQELPHGWSSKAGGTGLGLALIDRVARLHGGSGLQCGNLRHGGAWVQIDLPMWAVGSGQAVLARSAGMMQ